MGEVPPHQLQTISEKVKVTNAHVPSNIEHKLQFPAAITPNEKHQIIKNVTNKEEKGRAANESIRTITEKEKIRMGILLENAKIKLEEIGITEAENLLPQFEQLYFQEFSSEVADRVGGAANSYGTHIEFDIPKGFDQDVLDFQYVAYHELAHFVTKAVIRKTPVSQQKEPIETPIPVTNDTQTQIAAVGFNRQPPTNGLNEFGFPENISYGVYEESLADLFSIYCLNDESPTLELPYGSADQVPFMMSFLQAYADKNGITPIESFKRAFTAKSTRDFSFQQELVSLFGTDFVKDMDNIQTNYDHVRNKEALFSIAERGGFIDIYQQYEQTLNEGGAITFPGLHTSITRHPNWRI